LANLNCLGLTTNQDFLKAILANADFQTGKYDTHFLQKQFSYEKGQSQEAIEMAAIAASAFDNSERDSQRTILQNVPSGWRNNYYQPQQETFLNGEEEVLVNYNASQYSIGENDFEVRVQETSEDEILLELNGIQERFTVVRGGNDYFIQHAQNGKVNLTRKERFPIKVAEKVKGGYISPMPGKVIKLLVEPGQEVKSGDGLLVLLSMKMENTICADEDGTVEDIYVNAEEDLEAGKLLLKMKGTE
jgi:acetyl/propionyl-CoA carboxylase alpha subunit